MSKDTIEQIKALIKHLKDNSEALKKAKIYDIKSRKLLADTAPKPESSLKPQAQPEPIKSKPANPEFGNHSIYAIRLKNGSHLVGRNMAKEGKSPNHHDVLNWLKDKNVESELVDPVNFIKTHKHTSNSILDHIKDNPHKMAEVSHDGSTILMNSLIEKHPNSPDYKQNNYIPQKDLTNVNFAFTPFDTINVLRFGTPEGNLFVTKMKNSKANEERYAISSDKEESRKSAYFNKATGATGNPGFMPEVFGKTAPNGKLIVGANVKIREKTPFFILQHFDPMPFYEKTEKGHRVGIVGLSREGSLDPVYAYSESNDPDEAFNNALKQFTLEVIKSHNLSSEDPSSELKNKTPGPTNKNANKLNAWLENAVYKSPKIILKDLLGTQQLAQKSLKDDYFEGLKKAKIYSFKDKKVLSNLPSTVTPKETQPIFRNKKKGITNRKYLKQVYSPNIMPEKQDVPGGDGVGKSENYFANLKKAVIRGPWGGGPEKPGTVLHEEAFPKQISDTSDRYVNTTRVHKAHGIGKIVGKEERDLGEENKQPYYKMAIKDGPIDKHVFIPAKDIDIRTRPVINQNEVQKLKTYLKTPEDIDFGQTWQNRYKNMMDSLQSGNIYDTAKIWKTLMNKNKAGEGLSFGERKLLQSAHNQLDQEIQAVTGQEFSEDFFNKKEGLTKAGCQKCKMPTISGFSYCPHCHTKQIKQPDTKKIKKSEKYYTGLVKSILDKGIKKSYKLQEIKLLNKAKVFSIASGKYQFDTSKPDESGLQIDTTDPSHLMSADVLPQNDSRRKRGMYVVGSNVFQRNNLPLEVLKGHDVHYHFFPSAERKYKIGATLLERNGNKATFVETEGLDINNTLKDLNKKIEQKTTDKQSDWHEFDAHKMGILSNHLYRQPKISLKDIQMLEPYKEV